MKPFTDWKEEFGISSRGTRRKAASPWRSTQHPRGARSSHPASQERRGCRGEVPHPHGAMASAAQIPVQAPCLLPGAKRALARASRRGCSLFPATKNHPPRLAAGWPLTPSEAPGRARSAEAAPAVGALTLRFIQSHLGHMRNT